MRVEDFKVKKVQGKGEFTRRNVQASIISMQVKL